MSTKANWRNSILRFYESTDSELVLPVAPVVFYDDFLGKEILLSETGSTGIWDDVIVGSGTVALTELPNGVAQVALAATSEAEDAVLYWGDMTSVSVKQGAVFQCRLKASVLPTAGTTAVWGMCGAHNLDKDTVAESAWFRLDGDGALDVETDDTTNDNDDKTTGITLLATEWHLYEIDFTTIADVRFYVDGARVSSAVTFDMSNLSDAEARFQPYFSLDKASGTSVGTLQIDFVRVYSKRT